MRPRAPEWSRIRRVRCSWNRASRSNDTRLDMRNYTYRVRDRKGKPVNGLLQGESAQAVAEALGKQGYFPMSIVEFKPIRLSFLDQFKPRVKRQDLIVFTRQLWTLQKAGLPLLTGLSALREQATSDVFRKVIVQIIHDLE